MEAMRTVAYHPLRESRIRHVVAALVTPVAVILAAGVGRRLATLTHDRPKALVEIGGRSLLERALDALLAARFSRTVVVTGYRADAVDEVIARHAIRAVAVHNPDYATANNIVSFLAAVDELQEGFCLLNSDVIFDPSILVDVAAVDPAESVLVIDADEPLGAEEMKVLLDGSGSVRRVSKSLDPSLAGGEYIGIARLSSATSRRVIEGARELVAAGRTDLYYEDAIDLVAHEVSIGVLPVRGRAWTEIDDLDDHRRAVAIGATLDGGGRDAAT
jgi:L-glutamine-phosphate cytidylyltransferase